MQVYCLVDVTSDLFSTNNTINDLLSVYCLSALNKYLCLSYLVVHNGEFVSLILEYTICEQ